MIRFCKNGLDFGQERVDMVLYNSHDLGCAFNLIASVWRKICSNGLMVSSDMFNFSSRAYRVKERYRKVWQEYSQSMKNLDHNFGYNQSDIDSTFKLLTSVPQRLDYRKTYVPD